MHQEVRNNSRRRRHFPKHATSPPLSGDVLKSVFEEIRDNWKLEAKSESIERYFFHVSEVKAIETGKKSYVIGRKGTGKTAIAEFFFGRQDYNQFCEKLSFKNFPFNDLYKLKNEGFTPTNQYITLWKYLIYSIICKLMVKNQAIDSAVRSALEKVFSPDPLSSLARWITQWTATDFNLSILGTGGGAKGQLVTNAPNWIERVEVLERVIIEHIDESNYFVLFDELDEDYRDMVNVVQNKSYTALLNGLFKAVQDVKATLSRNGKGNVLPVIFLRDDIYSTIQDPDKTKWNDYKIELGWSSEKIKDLLAYRLSRAIDKNSKIYSFSEAWGMIFSKGPIVTGGGTGSAISIFDYISRSTFFRPRDYISFIRNCAENSLEKRPLSIISPALVKDNDTAFSNYLKSEIIDEIQAVIPDISNVFDVISQIRKQTFTRAEFKSTYARLDSVKKFSEKDSDFVLQVLFLFSVIGNQPQQKNQQVFRYKNQDANINYKESLVVHRGLFKALQIL
ncbi:P-loop ATPase, Sll1717 family [Duganella sp. Leaf126]|uniref:P-loop ATPase, Sll1717 family n=1 Tax=Duganella sp. Leaf126 TaxID=1736266 RepID=UPI0009E6BD2C|nr:hypothetical protein [Duganella sp. Leaf126]